MLITDLRKQRGLSLNAFSEQSRMPVGVLVNIESGEVPLNWKTAKVIAPPLGRSPFSLLTANLNRLVMEEDEYGVAYALIEIAKASGQPNDLTPSDRQELARLEPVYAKLRTTGDKPLSLVAVQEMFTPEPSDGGYMPVRWNTVEPSEDPDPSNSGFMPVRPIDA